ncbi:hypothetical protein RchiOBHm_Chr5g0007201 [Rosa chinensis]|uniref:Sugar phosphate transporter domain-containing protein n=1 Tax=Rosa chinensis TaxID=74649 RepID=A0A2P6Q3Q9_ROSCH|nr:hypothetical protein RchiOBHm_Chr5g0007051 [Rosa chinensis]PRQ28828.1 hypothetical protein RchiOBHm_Chr5g0007201 [Rosa chinensis]
MWEHGSHFSVTALVGFISNASGYSASKHVPLWELIWFSLVANASITGMNLSLMLNSVCFYQISKLSMIPVVSVMEWIIHGVGICTVTDVKVNAKGFLCASVAILCTSLQQISIGSLQKKYSVGSFDCSERRLQFKLSPFSFLVHLFAFAFIMLSCSLAVFCNISWYLCIGRFSAVSFQVLFIFGHMKTVCVLTLGWLLFDSALTFKNLMGMALAVVGIIVYSWVGG